MTVLFGQGVKTVGVYNHRVLPRILNAAGGSKRLDPLRRVLKPGGTLHFLEHGLAPDERVRRWQRRLDPVQRRIAGGCHLTRPVADLLRTAGFEITELDVFSEQGTPKVAGADSLGSALSP